MSETSFFRDTPDGASVNADLYFDAVRQHLRLMRRNTMIEGAVRRCLERGKPGKLNYIHSFGGRDLRHIEDCAAVRMFVDAARQHGVLPFVPVAGSFTAQCLLRAAAFEVGCIEMGER